MPSEPAPIQFVSSKNHRFHLLDALRGIAALLVLAWHIPSYFRPNLAFPNGFLAVDFFFCLSGFVIAFSYEERLRTRMTMRDFVSARLIRLYPLYLLGAVLGILSGFVVAHAASDPTVSKADVASVILFSIFLVPNFFAHWPLPYSFPLNGPSWSLFYELAANLAFALFVRLRVAKDAVLVGFSAISLAVLIYATQGGSDIDFGPIPINFKFGLARVGYSFFIGILVCRRYRAGLDSHFTGALARIVPPVITFALVAVLLASSNFARSTQFQLLTVAIFFPGIVYLGAYCRLPDRWSPVCAFLGAFSYPLYILHQPLIVFLSGRKAAHFASHHGLIAQLLVPALCFVLVLVAWAAGKFYDTPVRQWLTNLYNSRTTRAICVGTNLTSA